MIEGNFRGNNHFWTNPQSFILSGFTKIDACGAAFFFFLERSVTFRSAFGDHEADWRGLEDAGRSLALCWPFFHWWCTSQQSFSCTRLAYTTGFTMKVCHFYKWPPSHRQPNRKTNYFLSPTVDFWCHDYFALCNHVDLSNADTWGIKGLKHIVVCAFLLLFFGGWVGCLLCTQTNWSISF